MSTGQRVAVVTGGGGGIGAAMAEELGRSGWFVVTVDPLVTLDGSGQAPALPETTADRIVAAGGAAMASSASVTDRDALVDLFARLAREHGRLDAVINVAGITRQTGFAHGSPENWHAVLDVHLGGFMNILEAALPPMAAQGHGSILGVTSGSGWRSANAGAYSCAKRVVASLVWQLGRQMPAEVTINAISPIAATRMVAAAAARARKAGTTGASGGLSLFDSMPQPEQLAPLGAHLVDQSFAWCSGRVIFAGGSEVAVVDEPRLIEVVRTDSDVPLAALLEATMAKSLIPAEAKQVSEGGSNPRFGSVFSAPLGEELSPSAISSCLVVSGEGAGGDGVAAALEARSIVSHRIPPSSGFDGAADAWQKVVAEHGPVDAIVLVPGSRFAPAAASASASDSTSDSPSPSGSASASPSDSASDSASASGWQRTLDEHVGMVGQIEDDAAWARAAADYAKETSRTIRLLTVIEALDSAGRSRAQASAQLARSAKEATEGRVVALSIGLEDSHGELGDSLGDVVAYLLSHPEAPALAGAELVLQSGWFGLRSHPRPMGSITFGGPALPDWFDDAVREILGSNDGRRGGA